MFQKGLIIKSSKIPLKCCRHKYFCIFSDVLNVRCHHQFLYSKVNFTITERDKEFPLFLGPRNFTEGVKGIKTLDVVCSIKVLTQGLML